MSLEGLLIVVVMFMVGAAWAAFPLLRKDAHPRAANLSLQRQRLLVYYERIMKNIRDLDEDFDLGKADEANYQRERELWAQRGVEVLRALDELNKHPLVSTRVSEVGDIDRAIDDAIEAAISGRLAPATAR